MLNPSLFFKGNAQDALEFYRDALGGDISIVRFQGTPAAQDVPQDYLGKVLYGSLQSPLGTLAAMDAPPGRGGDPGSNFAIAVEAESEAQVESIFSKLSAGGNVMMPTAQTFFAKRFGMCTDKFGIRWMISYGAGA
jgi:PhnB protein